MSESQGYITKDQDASDQGHQKDFDGRDAYGNDRNDAGDADATGGDNQGDINLNIEQGGDAYAEGGHVVSYESYESHSYTQYQEPEYEKGSHEGHDQHQDQHQDQDQDYEESHDTSQNVF